MLRDLIKVVKNYCYGLFVVGLCLTGNNMRCNEWNQKVNFFFMNRYIYLVMKKKLTFLYSLTYNPFITR